MSGHTVLGHQLSDIANYAYRSGVLQSQLSISRETMERARNALPQSRDSLRQELAHCIARADEILNAIDELEKRRAA